MGRWARRLGRRLAVLGRRGASVCGAAAAAVGLLIWAAVSGCPSRVPPPLPGPSQPASRPSADVQIIRVRVAEGVERVRVAVDGPWRMLTLDGRAVAESADPMAEGELALERGPVWRLGAGRVAAKGVEILPRRPGTLRVEGRRYDGFLRVLDWGGKAVAVNVLHLEDYVAGVVTAEMPASFGLEALSAQAIIARSYGLYEKSIHDGAWDLSDGPEAQVYSGLESADAAGRIGRLAARRTRGRVLMFGPPGEEKPFGTFYHSTCGGMTCSIRYVKPRVAAIQPLAGGVRCDWCAGGKYRNWPPVRVAKSQFWPKVLQAAPAVANLAPRPEEVRVGEGGRENGHLTFVTFTGRHGSVTMLADRFRLIVGPSVMRSTTVRLTDAGDAVLLTDGHGWGHGVGLCQVGAGAQGRAGRTCEQILLYYYPGAVVRKLY